MPPPQSRAEEMGRMLTSLRAAQTAAATSSSRARSRRRRDPWRRRRSWNISKLCFESETEPYALARDKKVTDFAMASGIEVFTPVSHTLFDPADIINKNGGRLPLTYQSFITIAGEPPAPIFEEYSELPPVGDTGEYELLPMPTVEELGYGDISQPILGGDSTIPRRGNRSSEENESITSR